MKKEQEKAITVLEKYKQECIEEYKIELDDKDNIDQPRAFYLHQQIEAVYIVLNMLKEKDEKIEYYKKQKNYDDQFKHELLEEIRCLNLDKDEKDREIEKKDKIIDLMAEYIDSNNYVDNEECQFQWDFDIKKCIENGDCKECIKQYFEKLAERKSKNGN